MTKQLTLRQRLFANNDRLRAEAAERFDAILAAGTALPVVHHQQPPRTAPGIIAAATSYQQDLRDLHERLAESHRVVASLEVDAAELASSHPARTEFSAVFSMALNFPRWSIPVIKEADGYKVLAGDDLVHAVRKKQTARKVPVTVYEPPLVAS